MSDRFHLVIRPMLQGKELGYPERTLLVNFVIILYIKYLYYIYIIIFYYYIKYYIIYYLYYM